MKCYRVVRAGRIALGFNIYNHSSCECRNSREQHIEADRTKLELTERELREPEAGLSRYLIVGFRSMSYNEDVHQVKLGTKQGTPVGTEPSPTVIKELPLLAVIRIGYHDLVAVKYYVLITLRNGLCIPHSVSHGEVFLLPDFCENCGNLKERGPASSRLITKAVSSMAQRDKPPTTNRRNSGEQKIQRSWY